MYAREGVKAYTFKIHIQPNLYFKELRIFAAKADSFKTAGPESPENAQTCMYVSKHTYIHTYMLQRRKIC